MHTLDDKLEPKTVRRLELITGTGRRRAWSREEKARIVEETLAPGAVVSHIARRHGVTPQQLFGWRREARQQAAADGLEGPSFARVEPRRDWRRPQLLIGWGHGYEEEDIEQIFT